MGRRSCPGHPGEGEIDRREGGLDALAGWAAFWASGLRRPAPPVEVASEARPAPGIPDRPSIAVLPFDNRSDDPAQDYFSLEHADQGMMSFLDLTELAL